MSLIRNISKNLRALARGLGLDQRRCVHCLRPFFPPLEDGNFSPRGLCAACRKILEPYAGPRCPLCGLPSGVDMGAVEKPLNLVCERCKKVPPPWSHFAYHGLYTGALRDLLLRLKFDGETYLSNFLAELTLEAAKCLPPPDAVAAVPQHVSRLRKRGYNQAHEIARFLARLGNFELEPKLLKRIRHGPPQERLGLAERRANMRGAFESSPKAAGLNIWLVDDVMTTGSTFTEAVLALKAGGAKNVCAVFVARTPLF